MKLLKQKEESLNNKMRKKSLSKDPTNPCSARAKKYYMKLFRGDKDLYKEFLSLYDRAVEKGSAYPRQLAMIWFREKYTEISGRWVLKA